MNSRRVRESRITPIVRARMNFTILTRNALSVKCGSASSLSAAPAPGEQSECARRQQPDGTGLRHYSAVRSRSGGIARIPNSSCTTRKLLGKAVQLLVKGSVAQLRTDIVIVVH